MTQLAIRSQIIAPPDKYLLSIDLSQAEAWIVAMEADEPRMKNALRKNIMHEQTAQVIFDRPLIEDKKNCGVTKDERFLGKKYNHACVDHKTEVLTKDGWISIALLEYNIEIAQWNLNDKSITFTRPLEIIKKEYNGQMLHWLGSAFSQFVTPDHKMLIETNKYCRPISAQNLYSEFVSGKIPTNGLYNGNKDYQLDLIALIVAIQADATRSSKRVIFHLRKQRKIQRLKNLLENCNIEYYQNTDLNDDTYIRFNLDKIPLDYLTPNLKDFTWKLLELSQNCLDKILSELEFWDGYKNKYISKNLINCIIIQTIAHLRGKGSKINQYSAGHWWTSINNRSYADISCMNKYKEEYNNFVYCVTVPTGYFLVRRYDHISITGNCNYRMGYLRAAEVINKESDKPPYVTVTSKQSKIYHTKWNQFYDLKRWWLWIENDLRLHHYIITCYGRKIYLYGTLDIELFKKATALRAQSAIADHMFGRVQKEVGVVGGLKKIKEAIVDKSNGAIKIINTSHDSGILEVPKSDIKGVAEECLKYLQRPIVINGEEFIIPADSEYGERWGELEKI